MAKRVTAKQVERKGKLVWRVLMPLSMTEGKQQARFFKRKDDAIGHASMLNAQRQGPGEEFARLPAVDQDKILRALRAVGGDAGLLEQAAVQFAGRTKARTDLTLQKLVDDCLEAKEAAGMSVRGLRTFKCAVGSFIKGQEDKLCRLVTGADVTHWLNGQGWGARTRKGRLVDVRTLFNFAVTKKWLVHNPTDEVTKPKASAPPRGILKVREVARLLVACRRVDPGLLPHIALSLFGGLRPEREAQGLGWANVANGHLTVDAETAKGRKRRVVPINDTLKSWLALGGDLRPTNLENRMAKVRAKARIPWPHDCLRHSYISYALPLWGEEKVAAWAGHSTQVLHEHYKALVSDEDAKRFWALKPRIWLVPDA